MKTETLTPEEMSALDEIIADKVAREKARQVVVAYIFDKPTDMPTEVEEDWWLQRNKMNDDFDAAERTAQLKAGKVLAALTKSHGPVGRWLVHRYCAPKIEAAGLKI